MTDRPIIFSAPMVRALLDGRKTMTRRLAWGEPFGVDGHDDNDAAALRRDGYKVSGPDDTEHRVVWPPTVWQKAAPGERLWVRENWRALQKWDDMKPAHLADDPSKITFEADPERRNPLWAFGKLRSAIHMPRWASRLTLIVEAAKVERLQEITETDAVAEGFHRVSNVLASERFADIWDELHGAGAWDANPEVVAISFKVVKANIDAREST